MVSIPLPVKVTVCVLPITPRLLSGKIKEALRLPDAEGVKVTLTVQALPGATVAPVQVSALLAKSPAFAPLSVTVETVRLLVPVLVIVAIRARLVVLKA